MHLPSSDIPLCALEDIPEGASRGFLPDRRGRDRIVVVRQGDRVYGYVNNCPHYDRAPLGWKKDEFLSGDRQHIMCAAHGALFRIDDGACIIGPCLGQNLVPVRLQIRRGNVVLESGALDQSIR